MCIGAYKSSTPAAEVVTSHWSESAQKGDRVVFSESYGDAKEGDLGTIAIVGGPDGEFTLITVDLDKGGRESVFGMRLEQVKEVPKAEVPVVFKNGDHVVFTVENLFEGYSVGTKGVIDDKDLTVQDWIYVRLNKDTLVLVGRSEIKLDDSQVGEEEYLPEDPAPAEEPSLAPGVVPFEINGELRYFKLDENYMGTRLDLVECHKDGEKFYTRHLVGLTDDGRVKRHDNVDPTGGYQLNSVGQLKQDKS